METQMNTTLSENKLVFSEEILKNLNTTQKWAKFLAILGFIGVGIMFIAGIVVTLMGGALGFLAEATPSPMVFGSLGLVYVALAVLYFFPLLYLWRFASNVKNTIVYNAQNFAEKAFFNLMAHYRFVGILMIILISLYLLIFVGIIIFSMASYSAFS